MTKASPARKARRQKPEPKSENMTASEAAQGKSKPDARLGRKLPACILTLTLTRADGEPVSAMAAGVTDIEKLAQGVQRCQAQIVGQLFNRGIVL